MAEITPPESPQAETPAVGVDRRRSPDRRGASRDGKRDRRQNTCGRCQFFTPASADMGLCQKHLKNFQPSDYACVLFKALL
jgi:hypothetical protein